MKLLSERMHAMATKKRIRTPAIWTILRDYAGEADLLERTIEICSHEILRLERKERDLEADLLRVENAHDERKKENMDFIAEIALKADYIKRLEEEKEALRERNHQGTYCAYCGEEFPLDIDHTYLRVGIHIWECEKHPLNTLCEALDEKLKDLDFDAQEHLTTGKENDLSHASGIHKSIDSVREVLDDGKRHCKDMKNELDALLTE